VIQCTTLASPFSDHRAVLTDLRLRE
jgi:hypothetical protein